MAGGTIILISALTYCLLVQMVPAVPASIDDKISDNSVLPYSDDEDFGESGSGSGNGGRVTGSGHGLDSGSLIQSPNVDQRTQTAFYRIQLQLTATVYNEALSDQSTDVYQSLTTDLLNAVRLLYEQVPGQQLPTVVMYSPSPDNQNVFVTMDLASEGYYDETVLRSVLERALQTGNLGRLAVSDNHFQFISIGNGGSCPNVVGPEPQEMPQLGNANARLIVNQIFPCKGWVVGFEYHRGRSTGDVYIDVWRMIGELRYRLLRKVLIAEDNVGVHRVELDEPIQVQEGDFVGLHYADGVATNVVSYTIMEDEIMTDDELYRVYTAEVFDNSLTEGDTVNFRSFTGSEARQTYALRSFVDYNYVPPEVATVAPPASECGAEQFRCFEEEVCVPLSARCNVTTECPDASDEFECPSAGCTYEQFTCGDGTCVNGDRRCDGRVDCVDGTDEVSCAPLSCKPDQFLCKAGPCIPVEYRCDGRVQCPDATDEIACPASCLATEFTCPGSGRCIVTAKKCDGNNDCEDGADETGCSRPVCRSDEFVCESDGRCLNEGKICDGRGDCNDRSDERGCEGCSAEQYTCPDDGYCLDRERLCDGERDCRNGADEDNCARTCSPHEYTCPGTNTCLPRARVCDGRRDCEDGADEATCVPITITIYPTLLNVRVRQDASFQCFSRGSPPPQVEWVRSDGRALPAQATVVQGRLSIPRTSMDDSGDYLCRAVGLSDVYQETAMLLVEPFGPVAITSPPRTGPCDPGQTQCRHDGRCLDRTYLCDGDFDCADQSDESNCVDEHGCEPNEIRCQNEKCIQKIWLCDADDDCGDNTDERNCPTGNPNAACRLNEFQCASRDQCVPLAYQCDGEIDCQDRSDEIGCSPPYVITPPPDMVMVEQGGTITITCRANGVPVPLITWRLNWGHLAGKPPRITQTSEGGYGVLTIYNAQKSDQGAYTCEALNSKGAIFAQPDAILKVKPPTGLCQAPMYNAEAASPSECLRCFCFGKSTQCVSTGRNLSQIPLRNQPRLVDQSGTRYLADSLVVYNPDSYQYVIQDVSRQVPDGNYFWTMPREMLGEQLSSYGGALSFRLFYDTSRDQPSPNHNTADVIIKGNGVTLYHKFTPDASPNLANTITVPFREGLWSRSDIRNSRGNVDAASRADMMMALANIDYILVKLRLDTYTKTVRLGNIMMDTAVGDETGQSRAVMLETCTCPPEYTGDSCHKCAKGYRRVRSGAYLGECVPCLCHGHTEECDESTGVCMGCQHNTDGDNCERCESGFYGDARLATSSACQACRCPLAIKSNQFTGECYTDVRNNNQLTCRNCPPEYEGIRCERCKPGFIGNPEVPGDYCRPVEQQCDARGSLSALPDSMGQCPCKTNVEGSSCTRCRTGSFGLSRDVRSGCLSCVCSGRSQQCSSAVLYRAQVESDFRSDVDGFSLTNSGRTQTVDRDITVQRAHNMLTYSGFSGLPQSTYYWRLPAKYLNNKLSSYGGRLSYLITYTSGRLTTPNRDPDVILEGGGLKLIHSINQPISARVPQAISVLLNEDQWRKENGGAVSRDEMMAVLARIDSLLIKATYTLTTAESSVQSVLLDTADSRPRSAKSDLVYSVEQCVCPAGYTGLSCQDCAVGHRRQTGAGLTGTCVPCTCNGHADTCDPQTGKCLNCRHGTTGDFCQSCDVGYYGDATRGSSSDCRSCPCPLESAPNQFSRECFADTDGDVTCRNCRPGHTGRRCERCEPGYRGNPYIPGDSCTRDTRDCNCDDHGTRPGSVCDPISGQCQCKDHVTGVRCDQCRAGYFSLSRDHVTGCLSCYCSGVTSQCESAGYFREQVGFAFDGSGRTELSLVTRRDFTDPVTFTGYAYDRSINGVRFNNFRSITTREPLYWSLPQSFLGNKMTSYGGLLRYTAEYRAEPGSQPISDADVELISGGIRITYKHIPALESSQLANRVTISLPLVESSFRHQNGSHVDRRTLMIVLSDLSAILIRASLSTEMSYVTIGEVSMDTAVARSNTLVPATAVERCVCPEGYTGLSCESCAVGYTRYGDPRYPAAGRCGRCDCNGHSTSCSADGRCLSCQDNTYGDRCQNCIDGYYGDATRGTRQDCKECPCPLTIMSNKFSTTCRQDADGAATCTSCARGYTGRNCERCDSGYYGNPLEPGMMCKFGAQPMRPTVTVSPRQVTKDMGDSVRFTCDVTGSEPIRARWSRRDGRRLGGNAVTASDRSLTLTDLSDADMAEYVCMATNPLGRSEDSATLKVMVQQDIDVSVEEPKSLNINEGSTARFVCKGRSQETYNLVWQKQGGLPLPANAVDLRGVLVIPNVRVQDAGVYVCTGSNPYSIDSDTAVLAVGVVVEPPHLEITPQYQTVSVGERVEIRCTATGRPEPSLEFVRTNGLLNPLATFRNGVFVIPAATQRDEGEYACKATNVGGDASMLSVLYIRGADSLVEVLPADQTVAPNEAAEFTCRSKTGSRGAITWSRADGSPLPRDVVIDDGLLLIPRVTSQHVGTYTCTMHLPTGQIGDATGTLNMRAVSEAPIVEISPAPVQTVTQGANVLLRCIVRAGGPDTIITWRRQDGRPLPRSVVAFDGELRFSSVRGDEAGAYVCTGTNQFGRSSATAFVQLLGLPVIRVEPVSPVRVLAGSEVTMECASTGTPEPTVQWRRVLPEGLTAEAPRSRPLSPSRAQLYIGQARVSDSGLYVCTASNSIGTSEEQVQLIVTGEDLVDPEVLGPEEKRVAEGADIRLVCRISGDASDYDVTWSRAEGRALSINSRADDDTLYIDNIRPVDEGRYICSARLRRSQQVLQRIVNVIVIRAVPLPVLVLDPATSPLVVQEGTDVTLTCRGTGDPTPEVHWQKSGSPRISGPYRGAAAYNIERARLEDGGVYECTGRNAGGTVTSSVELRVEARRRDIFVEGPIGGRAVLGSNVMLLCKVRDDLGGRWYFEWSLASGRPLPDNLSYDGATLYIDDVREDSSGDYRCVARQTENGRLLQDVYTVRVVREESMGEVVPRVVVQPDRLDPYTLGSSVQLQCLVITGYPRPLVQWSRASGRAISAHSQLLDRGILRLTSLSRDDEDDYVCTATNRVGSARATVQLQLQGGATTGQRELSIIGPARGQVALGNDCVLICDLDPSVGGKFYFDWRRDGQVLPQNSRVDDNTLFIDSVRREDGGLYKCIARSSTDSRQLEAESQVTILDPHQMRDVSPTIRITPRTLRNVAMGSSLTLQCLAVSGYPIPQISWSRRSGRPLSSNTRAVGGKLEFGRLSRDDEDTYTCAAVNRLGTHSGEATISLTGQQPGSPRITMDQSSPLRVRVGQEVRVLCRATGSEDPLVYWRREDTTTRPQSTRGHAQLIINQVNEDSAGIYVCVASNAYGQAQERLQIIVEESDPGVTQRDIYIDGPQDGIVQIGTNVMLVCRVREGIGRFYFDWRFETAAEFGGNVRYDDSTLYIDGVTASDVGRYRCVAQSAVDGRRLEAILDLRPVDLNNMRDARPRIAITPDNLESVAIGSSIVLQCRAVSGFPVPEILWTRASGRALSEGTRTTTGGRLEFTRLTEADEDTYNCTARNRVGVASGSASLRLSKGSDGPIELRVSPEPTVTVSRGASASFHCQILRGSRPATLSWRKESGRMSASTVVMDTGEIRFSRITDDDAGFYVCEASNRFGQTRVPALLRIVETGFEAGRVPIAPYPGTLVKARRGSEVILRCQVPGQTILDVVWTRQSGVPLPAGAVTTMPIGQLKIPDVTSSDEGVYFCTIRTPSGSAREQLNLKINSFELESGSVHAETGTALVASPLVEILHSGAEVVHTSGATSVLAARAGDQVQLTCVVKQGQPTPSVVWTRASGRPLPITAVLAAAGNSHSLRLASLSTEDEDSYLCTATNHVTSVTATAKLNVRSQNLPVSTGSPRIVLSQASPLTVVLGHSLSFECRAEGDPTPRVYWSRGTPLGMERGEVGVATYVITKATQDNAGWYQCTAHNDHGKAYKRLELIVANANGEPSDTLTIDGPDIRHVNLGDNAQLVCRAKESGLDMHWSRKRGILPLNHRTSAGVLYLYNLQPSDSGEYVCSASRELDGTERHKHVEVIVLGPPSVSVNPAVLQAEPGIPATLICDAEGYGDITVKWFREGGRPLSASVLDDGYGYLEFQSVTTEDAGRYRCEAVNEVGTAEAVAQVIVTGLPTAGFATQQTTVRVGDKARLECLVSGSPPPLISWSRDTGPLSADAQTHDKLLTISSVRLSDAGRYVCTAANNAGSARAYIQLYVIDGSAVAGGEDLSGIQEISSKVREVNVGERVELRCEVQGSPPPSIRWVRDGAPLPADVTIDRSLLTISRVDSQDGGTYRCIATNEAGSVQAKVTLIVQGGAPTEHENTERMARTASMGTDVVLKCDAPPQVRDPTFVWRRLNGTLPSGSTQSKNELRLAGVQATDGGQYVCMITGPDSHSSEQIVQLVIGDLVPYFLQEELSYMAYPPIPNAELDFDVEISFRPESADGLLLYSGASVPGEQDFIAFGVNNGYPELRYDCGSGHAVLVGNMPLRLGEWCNTHIRRHGREGILNVNGQEYRGFSPGVNQQLDLHTDLYVGGVPNFNALPRSVGFQTGFKGAVSRIAIGGVAVDLGNDATQIVGVKDYQACRDKPCQNGGHCVPANQEHGYRCQCSDGYTGYKCEKSGNGCYTGACGKYGMCMDQKDGGFECLCPVGRSGQRCQSEISINVPSFNTSSYIGYDAIMDGVTGFRLELHIKPNSLHDSLILYNGDKKDGRGDFLALLVQRGKLVLVMDAGGGIRILESPEYLSDAWSRVTIEKERSQISMSVNQQRPVTLQLQPVQRGDLGVHTAGSDASFFNLSRMLYIGGVPGHERTNDIITGRGFTGCISKVLVNGQEVDLVGSAVVSARVHECTTSLSCQVRSCSNGATCQQDAELQYYCKCSTEFTGRYCQTALTPCSNINPCQHEGVCTPTGAGTYRCLCPLGYGGRHCEQDITLDMSGQFSGDGYLELPNYLLPHLTTSEVKEIIQLTFASKDPDGLLFWQGQDPLTPGQGEDYISIAMNAGKIEFSFELGSGAATIVTRNTYNDGYPHTLVAERSGSSGTLTLDGDERVTGVSTGILQMLDVTGNIYIGGVPNLKLMTSPRHKSGFKGCISDIEIMSSGPIVIQATAVSASNVDTCSNRQRRRRRLLFGR